MNNKILVNLVRYLCTRLPIALALAYWVGTSSTPGTAGKEANMLLAWAIGVFAIGVWGIVRYMSSLDFGPKTEEEDLRRSQMGLKHWAFAASFMVVFPLLFLL